MISRYIALAYLYFARIDGWMQYDCLRKDLELVTQKRSLESDDSLAEVLKRLDELELANLPERLQHYLNQRSYTKALIWLDNPDMPHNP